MHYTSISTHKPDPASSPEGREPEEEAQQGEGQTEMHTVENALTHISQPQPLQVGRSSLSEASQQVLHEALPPILFLHAKCFLYDATTNCIL